MLIIPELQLLATKIYGPRIGGYVSNPEWIRLNLEATKRSESHLMIESQPEGLGVTTAVYPAGGYVVVYQFGPGLLKPRMMFIHFELNIKRLLLPLRQAFSPRTLERIVDTQAIIESLGVAYLESAFLINERPPL